MAGSGFQDVFMITDGRWNDSVSVPMRKVEAVLLLLRGEEQDVVSGELGVTAARLLNWRETFLAAGLAT